jgi:predicted PurR-regulated permease PerM
MTAPLDWWNTCMRNLEDNTLLLLVVVVSLAFAWILWPFYEAVLWATVLAIVFRTLSAAV